MSLLLLLVNFTHPCWILKKRTDPKLLNDPCFVLHVFILILVNKMKAHFYKYVFFCSATGHHLDLARAHGIGFAAVRRLHTGGKKCKGHIKLKPTQPPPRIDGSKGTSMCKCYSASRIHAVHKYNLFTQK